MFFGEILTTLRELRGNALRDILLKNRKTRFLSYKVNTNSADFYPRELGFWCYLKGAEKGYWKVLYFEIPHNLLLNFSFLIYSMAQPTGYCYFMMSMSTQFPAWVPLLQQTQLPAQLALLIPSQHHCKGVSVLWACEGTEELFLLPP